MDEITLKQWASLKRERLQEFCDWWEDELADGASVDDFPEKLSYDDWDEEFDLFRREA